MIEYKDIKKVKGDCLEMHPRKIYKINVMY